MAKRALLDRLERGPRSRPPHQGRAREGARPPRSTSESSATRGSTCVLLGLGPGRPHRLALPQRADAAPARSGCCPAEAGLEPFVDRVTMSLPTLSSARRDPLRRRGRVESGRGSARVRRGAEPGHACEPRPGQRAAEPLQSSIALLQPSFRLDRGLPICRSACRGSARDAGTRQARAAQGARSSAPRPSAGDARPGRRLAAHEP